MSDKKDSSKFIKININNGEKSSPPAEGIYFLMGANDLYETSSISSRKAFELDGETQLKITPPITAKKMTLKVTIMVCIIATPARTVSSY